MLSDKEILMKSDDDMWPTISDKPAPFILLLEDILALPEVDTRKRIRNMLSNEALRQEFGLEYQGPLSQLEVAPNISTMNRLRQSFEGPFLGDAQGGLFSYLEENNSLFKDPHTPKYYGKFCSIVQSSGTGKSRAMVELRTRGVIVLYINIRNKNESNVFPPRDSLLADVLTTFPPSEEEYAKQCYALFTAIFRALRGAFTHNMNLEKITGVAPVEAWNRVMCNFASGDRKSFFQNVMKIYQTVLIEIESNICKNEATVSSQSEHPDNIAAPTSSQLVRNEREYKADVQEDPEGHEDSPQADGIKPSSSKTRFKSDGPVKPIIGEAGLKDGYEKWILSPKNMPQHDEAPNKPQLVIEFDEAHTLSDMAQYYRPSRIICQVISAYSRRVLPVWVLFASTTSQVADFSAPSVTWNSLRVSSDGELPFPPYIHLGWDQHAQEISSVPPSKVADFRYIASLGRPLWRSLMNFHPAAPSPMETVCEKLCGSSQYNPRSDQSALAVLGARFCLDVCLGHHESNKFHTQAVASHLRVLQAVTADRVWQTTEHPSEPLLACTAASILRQSVDIRDDTLSTLHAKIKSGMIDTGRRGELTSRLILLIAKDIYVGNSCKDELESRSEDPWAVSLRDCRPIPVIDFLEFLFGPVVWSAGGREMFQHCRSDFARRHWYRTSGVQCSHNQRLIDKVIPIYYNPPVNHKLGGSTHRYSQILISDKTKQKSSYMELDIITPQDAIGCNSQEPYIAILLDLCVQREHSIPVKPSLGSNCLRIYASGMTTTSFPFFSAYPKMFDTLRDILILEDLESEKGSTIARLAARTRFGETVGNEHILWDVNPGDFDSYNENKGLARFWQG